MEDNVMNKNQFGPLQIGIILLTAATAIIHLSLGLPDPAQFWMFILNGLGYLTLLVAFFLPPLKQLHSLVRWVLILFAAVTIVAWVLIGQKYWLGYTTKLIEVVLIVFLFMDMRQGSSLQVKPG
jgi:hypothetical protein